MTYKKGDEVITEQQLFRSIFEAIEAADQFIVLDFFLYNDYYDEGLHFPELSSSLTDKLIEKKQSMPDMDIVLITDEINTSYRSHENWQLDRLKEHGIEVMMTDVNSLRDPNPLYSGIWRMFFQWFGQKGKGRIPNLMADQAPDMTVRSYLKLLNVKANHRKTVISDKTAIILSGNPHDASFYNSNIGFQIGGEIIQDALITEQAAANLSGGGPLPTYKQKNETSGDHVVQLITEGKVLQSVLKELKKAENQDEIWIGMFYLAERKVIEELISASERGAEIKIILDPNENAFGAKKTGLPNRPVARELNEKTDGKINIRWYNTTDEQYHPKLLYIKHEEKAVIIGGSSNFTARNLDDYNLETNVYIESPLNSNLSTDVNNYFKRLWENRDGEYTLDFEEYQDVSTPIQRLIYATQKWLHFTTY